MNMSLSSKRLAVAALLAGVIFTAGCGTSGEDAAPGATVNINPATISWEADVLLPVEILEQAYVITVKRGNAPLTDTAVEIFLDLAAGTSSSPGLLLLDKDGNPQVSPYKTTTDANGNVRVFVDFPIGSGAAFKANLQAFSGAAFALSTIEVTCVDAVTTDATVC